MKQLGCKVLRDFSEWDLELGASFFHLLDVHIPNREGGDQVRLRLKRNGQFSVCSFYLVPKASNAVLFPWKGIWGLRLHRGSLFCLDNSMGEDSYM